MRLFAAVPVPPAAAAELGTLVDALAAEGWPVRWVRPESLHLTLKFYGEVAPDAADALAAALAASADGTPGLDLAVSGIETLPPGRRARVVVGAIDAPPALELLQDRLERASAALGFAPEGRPFRPHVTLGRVRQGAALPPAARERCAAVAPAIGFWADEVALVESVLAPGGSRYSTRHRVPLGVG
jgi:2'-5' RNA ligase